MNLSEVTGLRLLAMDGDDLKVISAACQDGVCKPADLVFEASRRRFRIEINRYCWEKATENQHGFRVRSVLSFEDVSKVIKELHVDPHSATLVVASGELVPGLVLDSDDQLAVPLKGADFASVLHHLSGAGVSTRHRGVF